uniref:SAP domain-containing protein n=1 Tax=Xiphophorus couchianus TaxID=32473 RepID=A0A3B5KNX6_9TELE
MPPPAAFHEQRRSLERARTEDYLKRKIRSRPERSELVRMHILEETSAEPSLQAKQLKLKRARLADDLNDKISHRPGPIELVHKNILSVKSVSCSVADSPKGAGGESSSLDEDSSDALSPDQLANHDSPLSAVTQLSPSHVLAQNGDMSPTQFGKENLRALTESLMAKVAHVPTSAPQVKKLKYHQYIPPDQKADKERPPQMDSSYAKLLQQQQLFLQLQILSQQQQHYNYHTILPPPSSSSGPSPSRTALTTTTTAPSAQTTAARQSQAAAAGAKPTTLPANLDEFKVAELKQELKLRGLTVSGTKNDLIERLRNYQEQNGNTAAALKNAAPQSVQQASASAATTNTTASASNTTPTFDHQLADGACFKLALSSLAQAVPGRVMRFGSTSSSPPVSPTPSERSLAGLSPDETSCNGDMFGEMVTSPLTQLTLHPSPQHPSNMEEIQSSCSMSKSSSKDPPAAGAIETLSLDKDQMLQEKDKQIEELTRMLRQKQRLVETLRSQLEQGKMVAGAVVVKKEGSEKSGTPAEAKLQTLIKASSVTPVIINQQNGTPLQTQAIALDLKANGVPTLVTDSNGNHYLIALSGHARDRQNGVSSLAKINGRITLQVKGRHRASCSILFMKRRSSHLSVTSQRLQSSPTVLRLCVCSQENGVNNQQMDDLFDILLKSGGNCLGFLLFCFFNIPPLPSSFPPSSLQAPPMKSQPI